ncbi:MAG: hypothetical protein MUC80_00090 [Candidatus Thermoplasmatota archaeon]|jgi:hypothetical protein|nr:hypothetical protein [Candidatus Thermoplasmatota archaeon]
MKRKKVIVIFLLVVFVGTSISGLSKEGYSEKILLNNNDDMGYKKDAGRDQPRSLAIYPGELIDNSPGRGRTGTLSSTDLYDWFFFSVCQGQQIIITVTPPAGFDVNISLWATNNVMMISSNNSGDAPETVSFIALYSGYWYLQIAYVKGDGIGQYIVEIELQGQNDASSGADAPNTIEEALIISHGTYFGYLDMNDPYDWYTFYATKGDWIRILLKIKYYYTYLTDFDLQLYNPNETLVYEGNRYYDENISYPVDVTGLWSIRVDIYPGWVDCPHPTNWSYYSYGSGAYNLTVKLETSGEETPAAIPQPDITPIAKMYTIANDPDSTKDDFTYLAAVPACNYLDDGQRYLAPIIYTGDSTPTAYYDDPAAYGTVDDTTQYLVDDWSAYLTLFGVNPEQYALATEPVQAASDIAQKDWVSSDTAVVAVDGSGFEDSVKNILNKTATLKRHSCVEVIPGSSTKIKSIGDFWGYSMFLGPKWCALNVTMEGKGGAIPTIGAIFPFYMTMAQDWWPIPYDATNGIRNDMYHPVNRIGVWAAGADIISPGWNMTITKIAGDRYRFRITDPDSVINAHISTKTASDLLVFLIDPQGNLRAPTLPSWNGPVNPIHIWNGLENPEYNPWRVWRPAPHTEFSAEVLHPETGLWTAIVVPRDAGGSFTKYTLSVDVRTINPDRADATVSAANAAVIASLNHCPLLYVAQDSVPAATAEALTRLGVTKVIFVERGEIGEEVRSKLPTIEKDLITMQQIVDEIKYHPTSENFITVTSLKTGEGFFAPAAMLAAYHESPLLCIEEAPGDPASIADRIHVWKLWAGDYYHGGRVLGTLPKANAPVQITNLELFLQLIKVYLGKETILPPFGLDADRYWNEEMYQTMKGYIQNLGLDEEGPEGYCFVAPRADIPAELSSTMMGNNSYAGDIPGLTPAYSSALVVRDLLYPALIWANPCRNITTSQIINYRDSASWWPTGDVTGYTARAMKDILQAHLRTYEGHCLWEASLQRMNQGASVLVYYGQSTGGSGVSEQYLQTNYSQYPDQIWWDAWRGYSYDHWKTSRDNGMVWYNPEPPMLYDFIHYKWVDQQLQNIRSNTIFYASTCSGDGDGPLVYLDHGAVCWIGNQGTGINTDLEAQMEQLLYSVLIDGDCIGLALSRYIWVYTRDYTIENSTSMYNASFLYNKFHPYIFGDPDFIIYSPEWTVPVPLQN